MTHDLKGLTPESWCCVDCGVNTFPGCPTRIEMERAYNGDVLRPEPIGLDISFTEFCEVYTVRDSVWKATGLEPYGGCLCIGCLENRIGRKLKPRDFTRHTFNDMPGTDRLLERREG
jgi:hypothetical protein